MNAIKATRKFYAAHSYMGTNFAYDAPCWTAFVFDSKAERDEWVAANEYNQDTGNYVAEAVTRKIAYQIAGLTKSWSVAGVAKNKQLGCAAYDSAFKAI